jgi:hypothetical protein
VNRPQVRKYTLCLCVAAQIYSPLAGQAQQATSPNNTPPEGIPAKSTRKLAKISKPADFSGAGLLQFEHGYDGDFRAPDARRDQAGTASVLLNATEDVQLEVDFDTFHSLTNNSSQTATGIGDAYANVQLTVLSEAQRRPSLGFGYLVKLPTASQSDGLGTGRADHKLRVLTSKKVRATDVDFNASLLVNGNPATRVRETGWQLALGFSHEVRRSFRLQGEVFGETLDTDQPRGLFVQGGLTYQPTARASVDVGVRAGLNSSAPRFGIFGGVSFSLANLYQGEPLK